LVRFARDTLSSSGDYWQVVVSTLCVTNKLTDNTSLSNIRFVHLPSLGEPTTAKLPAIFYWCTNQRGIVSKWFCFGFTKLLRSLCLQTYPIFQGNNM